MQFQKDFIAYSSTFLWILASVKPTHSLHLSYTASMSKTVTFTELYLIAMREPPRSW